MNPCRLCTQLCEPCYFSARLMRTESLISGAWYCLCLASMSTVLRHQTERHRRRNPFLVFYFSVSRRRAEKQKSVVRQLQACIRFCHMCHWINTFFIFIFCIALVLAITHSCRPIISHMCTLVSLPTTGPVSHAVTLNMTSAICCLPACDSTAEPVLVSVLRPVAIKS